MNNYLIAREIIKNLPINSRLYWIHVMVKQGFINKRFAVALMLGFNLL